MSKIKRALYPADYELLDFLAGEPNQSNDVCAICGADPMTANCNNAGCDV